MIRFQNLHKNKFWAFVDGFLTGLTVMFIAKKTYQEYQNTKLPKPIVNDETKTDLPE